MDIDIILGAGHTAAQVEELGALAEDSGIHTLWVSSFPGERDAWLSLPGLARQTRRLRLGVLPVSPYESHPLRLLETLYTLNEQAGGRASVLVGGLGRSVARVTGLKPVRRVAAVRDCVRILTGVRPDRPLDYTGSEFSLTGYQPRWISEPRPFVGVGATGPRMLAMAGEFADGVMMSDVPLVRMPEVLGHIDAGLAAGGRGRHAFRVNNFFAWHIGTDREAALADARRELCWRGLLQPWHTAGFLGDEQAAWVEANWPLFLQAFLKRTDRIEGVPEPLVDSLVQNLTFAGGLDDIPRVAAELHAFAEAGLDQVALKVHGNPAEAIRLIGDRLLPAVRG
ncbi:MAG: LLM class flavin-dependent oxidoreductase [Chromatiales bacterium]|jgi:alkanesulfonate monooxygenase SsuD/methylene tetrahydromethanopterin reductase-like flavin-dependent oxidoreductase (luciferase family)|nr:LLM class flavin-dependent oxidoreductase [Chromatiales bacterium]